METLTEIASTMYERTVFIFKAINPAKKYSQFSYYDAEFKYINVGDCQKGAIVKIDNVYYLYAGDKKRVVLDPSIKSYIYFKNGKQLIKEIEA